MAQTLSEKLISRHAGKLVYQNEIAIVNVSGAMASDTTAPLAIKAFREMGGKKLWDAKKVSLILDHATPAPNERIANLHKMMRDFKDEMGCHFYEIGEGICHQLMMENDHVRPNDLFVGADSHTPTYGALGAFAIGVGSTDLAGVLLTGKTWLKVPKSIRVELNGTLPKNVYAKDVILFLIKQLGVEGANYQTVEFTGSAVEKMTLASRMVLPNMVAEMGGKAGLVDVKGLELPYTFEAVSPDPDAEYSQKLSFDISDLEPQIATPHSPENVKSISEVTGKRINFAFIGSCTNSRLEDFHEAAKILKGKHIASHVRLIIAPASKKVFNAALKDGTIEILSEAGATFITSGCGPCVGTHQGVPGDAEVVISSTNRNFKGRMGNPNAEIYLASPTVVAASALAGEITDPRKLISEK